MHRLLLPFTFLVLCCGTARGISDTASIGRLLNRIAKSGYSNPLGMIDSSLQARNASKEAGYKKGIYESCCKLADLYHVSGDYNSGLNYALEALSTAEGMQDQYGIAQAYNVLGLNYKLLGDHAASRSSFRKSVELFMSLGKDAAAAIGLNNLANSYLYLNQNDSALLCFNRSLETRRRLDDQYGIGSVYNDMGVVYINMNRFRSADSLLKMGLEIMTRLGDIEMQAICMANMGNIHFLEGRFRESYVLLERSVKLAASIHQRGMLLETYDLLWRVYEKAGDPARSLKYLKLFMQMKDTIQSEENIREFTRREQQFRFRGIQVADSLRNAQEKKVLQLEAGAKLQRQQFVIYGAVGFIVLASLLILSLYRSNKQKKAANLLISHQKKEVEIQKEMVEVKQKEILDSIQYARRIQRSLLPTERYIERVLNRVNRK